jgi:EcoRII C terminal
MTRLREIFSAVAVKRLAAVDLPKRGSNQHELNGVQSFRLFFGTGERIRTTINFHFYRDGQETEHESTDVTFYDSRENQPNRSAEWRLYYRGDFLSRAAPGDVLVLARTAENSVHAFLFARNSGWLAAAERLFGITATEGHFVVLPERALDEASIELAERRILEELGFDVALPFSPDYVNVARNLLAKHDYVFPTTREMAAAARRIVRVDASDPDQAICYWLDAEEQLFYAMEAELLAIRLERRFDSVDEFIATAQSTLQRRKSRMGHSLQHHAAEIFKVHTLRFVAQARTERKHQPDFLFPGENEYRNEEWPVERLTMLAAKSTCKDRWRQILTEADRIPRKHLLTLDQALSFDQVGEMSQSQVQLVIPAPLQGVYGVEMRRSFMQLRQFIEHVRARE